MTLPKGGNRSKVSEGGRRNLVRGATKGNAEGAAVIHSSDERGCSQDNYSTGIQLKPGFIEEW